MVHVAEKVDHCLGKGDGLLKKKGLIGRGRLKQTEVTEMEELRGEVKFSTLHEDIFKLDIHILADLANCCSDGQFEVRELLTALLFDGPARLLKFIHDILHQRQEFKRLLFFPILYHSYTRFSILPHNLR